MRPYPSGAGGRSGSLAHKVKEVIERECLIEAGERVLVALSGGIDSTTLLYVLREIGGHLPFDLGIIHINHLLRGEESERDERFVRDLAENFSLPSYIYRVDVRKEAKRTGKSLQHAGRDVRYGLFRETAREHGYGKIAVAHTLDDQVETFLLRMLKGTGMRGLSAIPMKRDIIVRPLLGAARREIESYGASRGVPFVSDSSNEKTVYERNFVRKKLIPEMEHLNPAFREKIIGLLYDLTAVNRLFDGKAEEFMALEGESKGGDILLPVGSLMRLDEETRFRVMADVLGRMEPGFIPLREHMRQVDRVLAAKRPNVGVTLPSGLRVKRAYDRLTVTRGEAPAPPEDVFPVREGVNKLEDFGLVLDVVFLQGQGENPPFVPDSRTAYFDRDKLGELTVRTLRPGDRFVPLGMEAPVKLKDFFMSRKVPREERWRTPLVLSDDHVIWIVGDRVDGRYRATGATERVVRIRAGSLAGTEL